MAVHLNWFIHKAADGEEEKEENVTIISSSWCENRQGICLSFAVNMNVMDIDNIVEYGKEFVSAVNSSYKSDLLDDFFAAKSKKPLVVATDGGELVMMWSFQGEDNDKTRVALKKAKIEKIEY